MSIYDNIPSKSGTTTASKPTGTSVIPPATTRKSIYDSIPATGTQTAQQTGPSVSTTRKTIYDTIPGSPTETTPEKKTGFFAKTKERLANNDAALKTVRQKQSNAIGSLLDTPDNNGKTLGTDVKKNTLAYLPSSIAESLPFGVGSAVKAIHQEEAQAIQNPDSYQYSGIKNVTAMDAVKATPQAVADVLIKQPLSYALTFTGAGLTALNKIDPKSFDANIDTKYLKTNKNGDVTITVPGLGDVTNVQARIAERYATEPMSSSKLEFAGNAALYTGQELLNGLALASYASAIVNPRNVKIATMRGPEISAQTAKFPQPKSFRSFEQPKITSPVYTKLNPEFVQKALPAKYVEGQPTYARMVVKNGVGQVEIIQVKPSLISKFGKIFQKNPGSVPNTALLVLDSRSANLADVKKAMEIAPKTNVVPETTNVPPAPASIVPSEPQAPIAPIDRANVMSGVTPPNAPVTETTPAPVAPITPQERANTMLGIPNEPIKASTKADKKTLINKGEIKKPTENTAIKAEEALISEAKKYKTAEDFVKAQGVSFYHTTPAQFDKFDKSFLGTNTQFDNATMGFFFTDNPGQIEDFKNVLQKGFGGGFVTEARTKSPEEIAKYRTIEKITKNENFFNFNYGAKDLTPTEARDFAEFAVKKMGGLYNLDGDVVDPSKMTDAQLGKFLKKEVFVDDLDPDSSFLPRFTEEYLQDFIKFLEDKGYKGMISDYGKGKNEYLIFDPNVLQTKSQLVDIWNKANPTVKQIVKKPVSKTVKVKAADVVKVKKLEKELRNAYTKYPDAEEKLTTIFNEMDLAEKGERIFTTQSNSNDYLIVTKSSSFPKWLPENSTLRSKDLFNKIMSTLQSIDTIGYPTKANAVKQRLLVDHILTQLDQSLGIDTSSIRSDIKNIYDGNNKGTKIDNRSTAGSTGRGEATADRQQIQEVKAKSLQEKIDSLKQDLANPQDSFEGELTPKQIADKEQLMQEYQAELSKITPQEKLPAYKKGSANASMALFRDGTPVEFGGMDKIRPIELPEMVDIARELMGEVPKIMAKFNSPGKRGDFISVGNGSIRLLASLFEEGNIDQAAKTLAHEIGHLVDYLPEGTLKRGNLLGRLKTLQGFLKQSFSNEDGFTIKNSEIRKELMAVSDYWRPWDKTKSSKSFTNYRNSSKEIYADAISVLFNSPGTLERMAPIFYEEFFKALDQKPMVQNAFFEMQELLGGDKDAINARRRAGVQGMFKKGDMTSADIQRGRLEISKARANDFVFRFKFNFIDKNFAMIDRVNMLKKQGVNIPDDENPLYYLEERNYIGGKIKAFMEREVQPVYENLKKNDILWEDFGEALFYDRIRAGDRSNVANPRGITPAVAEELLMKQFKDLGQEKATILKDSMEKFRSGLKTVVEEAYNEGLIKPEMYDQMKLNPAYATFQVIDHIEDGMTSKIHKSIGTLKDVTNPADASLLKTISTIRAIERNKVTRANIEFLIKKFPEDIVQAKSINTPKGKRYLESKLPNQELITYMEGGKLQGYYIDPYISKSLNNENIGQTIAILRIMNSSIFRPLFITYNPGFQLTNFVRDLMRTWKNMPDTSFIQVLRRYKEALPVARARAFGKTDNAILQKMENDQILSVSYNQLKGGEDIEDKQIENILRASGIESFKKDKVKYPWMQPFVKALDTISNIGDFVETLPKVAAYLEFSNSGVNEISREQKSHIRKNIGSPDFLAGGYMKPLTNEVFLFSNSIAQGIRSDINVATDPKTRSGYWYKTAKLNILPKLLMWGVSAGLFGVTVKRIMDNASEYDKTNYTIIPLGEDENGKAIYFRLPQDEGGRLIGGLVWKAINSPNNHQGIGKDATDMLAFMGGQIPSISPAITNAIATNAFINGQNPYDFFRGQNVLTDDQFKAGGSYAAKPFFGWLFNQAGGSIFYKFNTGTPRDQGTVEKAMNLPLMGNIAGRFIKVSNYGTTETLNKIKAEVQSEQARTRIDENQVVNDFIKQAQGAKDNQTIQQLTAQNKKALVTAVLGHEPQNADEVQRAGNIVKKYQVGLQRGQSDPMVNSLISAQTNEEKIRLLVEIKKTLTKQEYNQLKISSLKYKIASPEVFYKADKIKQ